MIRKEESIIYCTKQIWKYRIGNLSFMVGILLVAYAHMHLDVRFMPLFFLNLAGCAMIFAGVAFPLVSVRCPKCDVRWQWLAVRKKESPNGYSWLARLSVCPMCGTSAAKLKGAASN